MTLGKGDLVAKLNKETKVIADEAYVEYGVVNSPSTWTGTPSEGIAERAASQMSSADDLLDGEVYCVALLRKIR